MHLRAELVQLEKSEFEGRMWKLEVKFFYKIYPILKYCDGAVMKKRVDGLGGQLERFKLTETIMVAFCACALQPLRLGECQSLELSADGDR